MNYLHEHIWLGLYGHLMIILAFVGSFFAAVCYLLSLKNTFDLKTRQFWKQLGKVFFISMSIFAICAIAMLYYIMMNRYFEFHYVWKYTNHSMGLGYMISSFWSGQEGSLLLWVFWIIFFSFIVLHKNKNFEAPVMGSVSLALVFLFSMLLGVYIGDIRIGNSPFILIRELPENVGQPWTLMPDYLLQVEGFRDGMGLNPLLQNYWMVIHPPVLFSGFAASLFPFAFAMAGLWGERKKSWLKPARPWILVALFTLGAGILMGGAWAYEALSFGGFWAWDPVENASLVPWLVLLGAAHSVMVSLNRRKGIFMSFMFCILPFILVIYSSFLTRSGILGESSVHSFTENGLMPHLLAFLFLFIMLGTGSIIGRKKPLSLYLTINILLFIVLLFVGQSMHGIMLVLWLLLNIGFWVFAYDKYYLKDIPEDHWSSREFWMVAGVLILLISAFQITLSTSVPVINRLVGTSFDVFGDLARRNNFYALWQVPFAIIVLLMAGTAHLLKYKKTNEMKGVLPKIKVPVLISFIITIIIGFLVPGVRSIMYLVLLFVASFAVTANFGWLARIIKKNTVKAGAAISHLGFGLLIAGALISGAGKTPISQNGDAMDLQLLDESFLNNENIMIRKGDTLLMDRYFITYRGKFEKGVNIHYDVGYYKPTWDTQNNKLVPGDSLFTLYPFIQRNDRFGNVAEPDTRHYLTHDVFTYVKWADTQLHLHDGIDDDYMNEVTQVLTQGDKWKHDNMLISFEDIYLLSHQEEKKQLGIGPDDIVVQASFLITDVTDPNISDWVKPVFYIKDSVHVFIREDYSETFQSVFRIARLFPEPNTLMLSLQEREYLVMQALLFPGMKILWTGCIVMLAGMVVAIFGLNGRKKPKEKDKKKVLITR
jgi:cytochrome c-type biogenesis protein CcmF